MDFKINPFIYGRAVRQSEFLGRATELGQIFSRLATGQSTAIIGQPHTGKTSILTYLMDEEMRHNFCGNLSTQDVFSFIDVHTLGNTNTQADFWIRSLKPLEEALKGGNLQHVTSVRESYDYALANKFGTFVLENLFETMARAHVRLILLIDEFDVLLSSEILNSGEFYGSLRSLASRSGGLVLGIASRLKLAQLNHRTQEVTHGSPYFNVFTEVLLNPFSSETLRQLHERAGENFNNQDYNYLSRVSGHHPYLAQAAAATLWDIHQQEKTSISRYVKAGTSLYRQTQAHFEDTWRFWTNETRKAVTIVALTQIPRLLEERVFNIDHLGDDMDDYYPELRELADDGILLQDAQGTWNIIQGAFLWWLSDELRRNVRDQKELDVWLRAQEMDGLFTHEKRQYLEQRFEGFLSAVAQKTPTLIESYVKTIIG